MKQVIYVLEPPAPQCPKPATLGCWLGGNGGAAGRTRTNNDAKCNRQFEQSEISLKSCSGNEEIIRNQTCHFCLALQASLHFTTISLMFLGWVAPDLQDIAPAPRKPQGPGDPRDLDNACSWSMV